MLAQNGVVAECTVNNIFIVKDGVIYTPPIYCGALDGITRGTVISLARGAGYELYEKEFSLFNVYNADECFLSGTGAECIAVTSADRRKIGTGAAGPVTEHILKLYRDYVQNNGTEIY
jgi:branched-chain amino acid aminotransferase